MKKIILISLVFCGFIAMSQPESYTTQKTYIDNNIKTNGVGSITGPIANTAYTYLLQNNLVQEYDATRPYKLGQVCVYNGNIIQAKADMSAGAWSAGKWKAIKANTDTLGGTIYTAYMLDTDTASLSNRIRLLVIADTGKVRTTGNDSIYNGLTLVGYTNISSDLRALRLIGTYDTLTAHPVQITSTHPLGTNQAIAGFDSYFNITGNDNINHAVSFQSRWNYGGSDTMAIGYGTYIKNTVGTGGRITDYYGHYIANPTGSGTIRNTKGIYIAALTKGDNSNYAIYSDHTGNSYIAGRLGIGTTSGLTGTTRLNISGKAETDTLTLRTGASIDEFSTDTTLAGNSDYAVPTEKAVKTYIKNRTYDYTICASGCDYSDITTAFTAIPAGKSVYVAAETFTETDAITFAGENIYFDGTRINYSNVATITISDSTSMNGKLVVSMSGNALTVTNYLITVTGGFNSIHNVRITSKSNVAKQTIFAVVGNYNDVSNVICDTGIVFTSNTFLYRIAGSYNKFSCALSECDFSAATGKANITYVTGDYNYVNSTTINNTSSASATTYGVATSVGADYNCLTGVSYGNDYNIVDDGASNNSAALVAP